MQSLETLCCVFDLDGTLVDTAPDLVDSLNATLSMLKLDHVPYQDAKGLIGGGARALITKGLEYNQISLDSMNMPELIRFFVADYASHIAAKSTPYPACLQALNTLKSRGVKLAVCTNKSEPLAILLLNALNLTPYFDAIIGGDTLPVSKPDPRPLRAAAARTGNDTRHTLLIGDSITDFDTARNASVPFIGVSFGYSIPAMSVLNPTYFIDHYDALCPMIDEIVRSDFA